MCNLRLQRVIFLLFADKRTRGFKINDKLDGRTLEACGSLISHQVEKTAALPTYLPFIFMLTFDVFSIELFKTREEYGRLLHLVTQAVAKLMANTFAVGLDVSRSI